MYHDEMSGFLSDLRDGAAAASPPLPSNNQGAILTNSNLESPQTSLMQNPRTLSAFTGTSFPTFSAAISSDRLSNGNQNPSSSPPIVSNSSTNPSGPVSRTLPILRSTGEPHLGPFNNLQAMPSPLSADTSIQTQHLSQRSPSSPIPHLQQSTFLPNHAYHQFNVNNLSHNQSPNNIARQTFNYTQQPPPQHHQHPSLRPSSQSQLLSINSAIVNPNQQPPLNVNHQRSISNQPIQNQHIISSSAQLQQPSQSQSMIQSSPFQQQLAVQHGIQAIVQHQQEQQTQNNVSPSDPSQSAQLSTQAAFNAPQQSSSPPPYQNQNLDANLMLQATQQQPVPTTSRSVRTKASTQQPQSSTQITGLSVSNPPEPRKRGRGAQAPKRARTNTERNQQNVNTEGRGKAQTWIGQTTSAAKNRSNNNAAISTPNNTNATGNTANSSAPTTTNTEEQSRPERKREREKRRRETMNTRFSELAGCLTISAGGKSDKESILAEAVEHVKKQATMIQDLEKQNRELMSAAQDLRAEKIEIRQDKNYIREERDRLKAELELLRSEQQSNPPRGRKRQKSENNKKESKLTAKDKKGVKSEPAAA